MPSNQYTITFQIPVAALRGVALGCGLLGILFLTVGLKFSTWLPNEPAAFSMLFYLFGAVAFFTAYRTYQIKQWLILKAGPDGIAFPCPMRQTCRSAFLHVPWDDIGDIEIGNVRLSNGVGKGVKIPVRVSAADLKQFFPESLTSLGDQGEWYTVGLTSAFLNKEKCLDQLTQLKPGSGGVSG